MANGGSAAKVLPLLYAVASVGRKSEAPSAIFNGVLPCRMVRFRGLWECIDIFDVVE